MPNPRPPDGHRIAALENEAMASKSDNAALNSGVTGLRKCLTEFLKEDALRSRLHWFAFFADVFGTVLLCLEAIRLNARVPMDALGTLGDPLLYRNRVFHLGHFGSLLLIGGIVVHFVVIRRGHKARKRARHFLSV